MASDNVAELLATTATGPLDRRGLSIFNVSRRYGLDANFFLGAALYHLLLASQPSNARSNLEAALVFVEEEIEREGDEPVSDENAIEYAPPDVVAAAYSLKGSHGDAVRHLLEICAYALDDHVDEESGTVSTPLEVLADLIEHAINELDQPEAAA